MKSQFQPTGSPCGVYLTPFSELECPICHQETGLHHDRVEVFERKEDALRGLHVDVTSHETLSRLDPPAVTTDENMEGNPSSRRNGVAIYFWCEHCSKESKLTIAQSKGTTIVKFERVS